MKRGVYVVAYGDHARECAAELIRTIHQRMPDTPVCLASEEPLGAEDVLVRSKQRDPGARWQKTRIWRMAPREWEQVLYLDADILLRRSAEPIFEILSDGWDMVMTLSPPSNPTIHHGQRRAYVNENIHTVRELGSDRYPQLAGGVWAFRRNERTERLLKTFHDEWQRFGKRDQQAMDRALYANPVSVWILGCEFNWFMHHQRPTDQVHIMHFATAARKWVKRHPGRRLWTQWRKRV